MKERLKGAIIGLVIGLTITATTVFATTGGVQKLLQYNNIKIALNGTAITPTDANGNYVEPFTIDGTTYLPVRAVANALGLNVGWDAATQTVTLSNSGSGAQSTDGKTLYNKGGIKITYTGVKYDDWGTEFKFLIENNTNQEIMVQTRDQSINGFMVYGIMSSDVMPGKKVNTELSFMKSSLEENNITSVQNAEFSFYICDKETWDEIDTSNTVRIELY